MLIIPQSDEMEFDGYRFDTRWRSGVDRGSQKRSKVRCGLMWTHVGSLSPQLEVRINDSDVKIIVKYRNTWILTVITFL